MFFFFKQKTAYEMRISDWSSDVCSSDLMKGLLRYGRSLRVPARKRRCIEGHEPNPIAASSCARTPLPRQLAVGECFECQFHCHAGLQSFDADAVYDSSEENTSALQSLMRNSYAVFCLNINKISHLIN